MQQKIVTKKQFEGLLEECEKARKYCCEKGKTAQTKKNRFTFGIGTKIVGLSLTEVVAGALLGVSTGAATFLIGKYFAKQFTNVFDVES